MDSEWWDKWGRMPVGKGESIYPAPTNEQLYQAFAERFRRENVAYHGYTDWDAHGSWTEEHYDIVEKENA